MEPSKENFPIFEANQVLTSGHLNDAFSYLDEQQRLTRANLLGIGIVCGLDIKRASSGASIRVAKGCGVTSEGYLIVEADDVVFVSYREYVLPNAVDYARFRDPNAGNAQYPLWELFADGEASTTPLNSVAGFLDNKAVLLLLELKQQGLRNCSPNNCDDKGSAVTARVKALLVERGDLDKIIAAANALDGDLSSSDIETAMLTRLNLPDVRMPRFDVPNTNPLTADDLYLAYLSIFQGNKLVATTDNALRAAYIAFKPLLQEIYPTDPFDGFAAKYGFLDQVPITTDQVWFLQYYYDLFDDLLRAYDEFRWQGVRLACACCPPESLFPRHLMLGLLYPEKATQPSIYRQEFLPSPAVGDCGERTKEVLQLFRRLVEMAKCFTDTPSLPPANADALMDPQIRVTPSCMGNVPLSDKAIPYFYRQDGTPPLYQLWSREKTRRNRANQNLSYRYDEYSPAAPTFVSNPLRYDLEPYNFLRIEGHLGKNYQRVLNTLLSLKSDYRLSIDVVALRSGLYDDTQTVDLSKESARFQDLEALYDALREELLTSLTEGVMYLYDVAIADSAAVGGTPNHPLLKSHAPNYRFPSGSVGAWYEQYLALFQLRPYIDVNQNQIDANAVLIVYCTLFNGTSGLPSQNFPHAVSIYYFTKLAEILPAALDALAYADFENKYQDLLGLVRFFRSDAAKNISGDLLAFIPQEDLIDHFDNVLFACKLDSIKSIYAEYIRRLRELKKSQFFGYFLQSHPGIQHKAGAPLGGTFVVVYHEEPEANVRIDPLVIDDVIKTRTRGGVEAAERNNIAAAGAPASVKVGGEASNKELSSAIRRIIGDKRLVLNPDISFVFGSLIGKFPGQQTKRPPFGRGDTAPSIVASAVDKLANGTVIADFYLPYLISSSYAAVQFVLPKTPPSFSAKIACPNADGITPVMITTKGGTPPYEIKVDEEAYQPLNDTCFVRAGSHRLVIRDIDGIESAAQTVVIASPMVLGEPSFHCSEDLTSYTAVLSVSGGTPPYTVDGTALNGNQYTSKPIASGTAVAIEIVDSHQCVAKTEFVHTCPKPCELPCNGIALRRGYRFWLPEPDADQPFASVKWKKLSFVFESPHGGSVDLSAELQKIVQAVKVEDLNARFAAVVKKWMAQINKLIANTNGRDNGLMLDYESSQLGSLGTLWIEHFVCLKFDFQLVSSFQRRQEPENLDLAYTPQGTTLRAMDRVVEIPAFDGIKLDKCKPQIPPEPLCAKELDLVLKIIPEVDGLTANLSVEPSGSVEPVAYVWEVQDGNPPMSNGQTAKFTFAKPGRKVVSVTAFTKEGCTRTQSDLISLG